MTRADAVNVSRNPIEISFGDSSAEIRGYRSIRSPASILFASYAVSKARDKANSPVKGTFLSVFHEWCCHSVASLAYPDDESLSGLTVQTTVFADAGHGFPGFAMKLSYLILYFPLSLYDLGFSGGWTPDW